MCGVWRIPYRVLVLGLPRPGMYPLLLAVPARLWQLPLPRMLQGGGTPYRVSMGRRLHRFSVAVSGPLWCVFVIGVATFGFVGRRGQSKRFYVGYLGVRIGQLCGRR